MRAGGPKQRVSEGLYSACVLLGGESRAAIFTSPLSAYTEDSRDSMEEPRLQ